MNRILFRISLRSAALVACALITTGAYAQTAPAATPAPAVTSAPAAAPAAKPARPPFVMPPRVPPTPEQIAQEKLVPVTPANPALPSIFIVSDSTAAYNPGRNGEELADIQGWGIFFPAFFDPTKVNVVNVARGGRSSRTYMTEGIWATDLAMMKPGDVVLIQLGQNDVFALNDMNARGTIPGIGPETQEIDNIATHKHEVVHTYGWYIRQYVADTKAKGAIPILMSLTTRNVWKDGKVEVGVNDYRANERDIAKETNIDFVDVSDIIAREYQHLGQEKTYGLFHDHEPVHMDTPGSFMAAYCTVAGLKALSDAPVSKYLAYMGQFVLPMAGQIPGAVIVPPAPPKPPAVAPAPATTPVVPAPTK